MIADPIVLAFDLGGTKVIAGAVNSSGEILKSQRELVPKEKGPQAVAELLGSLGKKLRKEFPQIQKCAIASAGPLDPERGVLLDPTNLVTDGKGWGEFALTEEVSKAIDLPVGLENDAAAAVLATAWLDPNVKDKENIMTVTLGTGLGVGTLANNLLVRSGRGLHPETGHLIVNYDDKSALCGCGNYGCAEAYLSGLNFCKRYSVKHNLLERISGQEALTLAKNKDPNMLLAFEEYSEVMAQTLASFVVTYAPEVVVFAGGFAAAYDYFIENTNIRLAELLKRRRVGKDLLPKLFVSDIKDHMVLLGAAKVALNTH